MKQARWYHCAITVGGMIVMIFYTIVVAGCPPQVPLAAGCVLAGLVARWIGYRWDEILSHMLQGVTNSLEAVMILMCIGMMMGAWIEGGTVPTMVFYGLKLMNARCFLATAFLFCGIVSMATGSWGAAGTAGLAFMAIGGGLGISAPVTAGAIISGAYLGDKCSPLSDTTNLAAAVSRCDVMEAVKDMLPIALAAFAFAGVGFFIAGLPYGTADSAALQAGVGSVLEQLRASFRISPLCLMPLVIVIACILGKIPSMPSLAVGIISGLVLSTTVQGKRLGAVLPALYYGYRSKTNHDLIDGLLTAGGIESMLYGISIIFIAMAFGGIMQGTGQIQVLAAPVLRRVHSLTGLTGVTMITCICANVILPDQYLSISVPGQMYGQAFQKRGADKCDLVNVLGAGGAVTSPLVPWNTCGAYMSSVLGVATIDYLPYCFFNLLMPVVLFLYIMARECRQRGKGC